MSVCAFAGRRLDIGPHLQQRPGKGTEQGAGDVPLGLEVGQRRGGLGAGDVEARRRPRRRCPRPARLRPGPRRRPGRPAGRGARYGSHPGPASRQARPRPRGRGRRRPPAGRSAPPDPRGDRAGTAPRSRPRSAASPAVSREPERAAASITTVIPASAAITRLRAGKAQRQAPVPGSSSERTRPRSWTRRQSERCAAG